MSAAHLKKIKNADFVLMIKIKNYVVASLPVIIILNIYQNAL
tara:strand:- start:278 stop:403 length:126 start_codon:yes stop_codon:yes gene_type:complete